MARAMFAAAIAAWLIVGALAGAETTAVHHKFPALDQDSPNQFSAIRNGTGAYHLFNTRASINAQLQQGNELAATAVFNATMNDYGWDYLYVAPNVNWLKQSSTKAFDAYFASGWLEGRLTYQRMADAGAVGAFNATCNSTDVCNWMTEHMRYMRTAASETYTPAEQPFYSQLGLHLAQLDGIAAGFNAAAAANGRPGRVAFEDVFAMNFGEEAGDVVGHFQYLRNPSALRGYNPPRHCSALIKVTPNDLFVSHDTWSSFQSMRRIYKTYAFNTTVTMSSYPGQIASQDDWYMTSHKLAVQETTNEFYNTSLYSMVVPRTVSEFLRVMIATNLATGGQEWTELFKKENSGTYNNQYMVVDMKLWAPGQSGAALQDNLLWVAEQIPGFVQTGDETKVLRSEGYWASYNVPYFKNIYDISGFQQKYEEQGDFWSYTKYARPEIFKRNQGNITDLAGMQLMMRYNDFASDPFSAIPNCSTCPGNTCSPKNSAMLTIASRGDLDPVAAPGICYGPLEHFVSHRDHCATDSKIAAWSNFQNGQLTGVVISGPTAVQQPVFKFSTSGFARPLAMPDAWNFPWTAYALPKPAYKIPHLILHGSNKAIAGIVAGAAVAGFLLAVVGVFYARRVRARSASRPDAYTNLGPSANRDAQDV